LSALSVTACSDGDFPPASRLTGLRLIAVQADKPAADAGEEINLSAIYFDAQGRSLSFGYALCDGANSSAALDCMRVMDPATLVIERDQPTFHFTMPDLSGSAGRASSIGVVVIVCPGEIVQGDTYGVPIACEVDGEALDVNDYEMGVKRIFFSGQTPNDNPEITELRWDGAAWPADEIKQITPCDRDTDDIADCAGGFRHRLEVFAPNAGQSFVDGQGNDAVEHVVAQFYATGGTFESDVRTLESAYTEFVAQKSDTGETLTLHVVVRDSRGGVSWETRQLEVSAE
ncbi:MAG TPA: hypothetical protein VFZ61_01795, partial [Polyangiales bacterium]